VCFHVVFDIFLGDGMVEVKNVVCRIASQLPGICRCDRLGSIGATVTCEVGIPLPGAPAIGASATINPCGNPASFGYRAWYTTRAGNRVVSRALHID
jgi:hypothetical protein